MKRLREESFAGSQFKRPFGTSRGESYGQPQNTVGVVVSGGQKLSTDDALQYLKEVKEKFQDQREKYDQFLEVMKNFKAQRIDTEGVIARVKELFKGHNNLIYGFCTFLPKGYEITMEDVEAPPKKTVEFEEAISFVNKIKRRFQDDDHVYKSFLDILNMYRKEHKNICEVYDEVSQLFEEHSDLLEEFTRFLPDNSSTATVHYSQQARSNLLRYDERSSAVQASRLLHMDKRWRSRDRVGASHVEHDLGVDHHELNEDRVPLKSQKDPRKRDKENRDRKNRDMDDRQLELESHKDSSVQHLTDKRKLPRKVEGFGTTPPLASSYDNDALKSMYSQEFLFCEKVKEKLGPDDFQAFSKCLNIYTTEIITRDELQHLVADLLGKYPGLVDEFNGFLQQCENIDGFLAGVMNKKYDGPLTRQVKTDEKDKGPKRAIDTAKEKPNKEYSSKSIQELDLSDCERCTPSYRLLPNDYPIPTASQRSKLGAEVLNDFWVSVTSGSEDYSFKHMRRNQYEESLFRCEDDRFELDMLLESVSSTAKRVEDALDSILDGPIRIEDYFTSLHLRCIERLYGDHGLDVIEILRKNPAMALPVILTRLKQKQEEWTKSRVDFNKVWAEIYAKNHFKSLDHRSFYFKQQDSKYLSAKAIVAEIKEMKENMQTEVDMLLAVAAGNKRPLVPHFEFEYSDSSIHEDLYKLIKFSSEEICSTKEQLNKVMRFYTTFLEPMLGVASRALGFDIVEDVKLRPQATRDGLGSDMGGSPVVDVTTTNPRQPKLAVSAVEQITADFSSCFGTTGDNAGKDPALAESNAISKHGSYSNAQSKKLSQDGVADRASPRNGRGHVESVSGPQSNSSRLHGDEKAQKPQLTCDPIQAQSEAANGAAGTFTQDTEASLHVEEGACYSKAEKEEGELSPNADIDDENPEAGFEGNQAGSKGKHGTENQQYQDGDGEEVGVENEVEDEDSENASEAGDDVSSSESAGDECSREEHEEEEDAEHDVHEAKAESEDEIQVHYSGGDVGTLPLSERFSLSVKPLAKYVSSVPCDTNRKDSRVFYGNDSFYVLFRLHRILYERMVAVKTKSLCSESKWRNMKDSSQSDFYASFITALYHLLDGSSDNAKYEDDCRTILGNQSYVLFTLDKLMFRLVKQLQVVATDDMENKLLQLYEYERSRKPGRYADSVYHENARVLLHEDNIYRLEFSSPYRMSVQLMDNGNEKPETVAVSIEPNFATYLNNDFLPVTSSRKEPLGIMLQRNKGNYVGLDEYSAASKAMEGVQLLNGLECKIACSSSKISYVLDTEDFLYRRKSKKKSSSDDEKLEQARVNRFHRFLSVACR